MIFKHARTYGKSNTFDANKMNNQKPAIMFMNMRVSNILDKANYYKVEQLDLS